MDVAAYIPSGNIAVSSPVETPWLAKAARRDWSGLTQEGHRRQLVEDLRSAKNDYDRDSALIRLRFYYPDVYTALTRENLAKRVAFETAEAKTQ